MVPWGAKMEAPSHPNSNRQDLKGAGGGGQPLKFAAPLQGEPGVSGFSHNSLQKLHSSARLPTAPGPSQKSSNSHRFSGLNFSTFCFLQNLQNL